jgi:hypothetical protein
MATQQQTVLRVQFDNVNTTTGITEYEFLDLYGDIPIKISKSFAELQDISKRNSDYSIGLQLPGSKKNNRFFENFFEVDTQSLYFNATKRVPCQVLLNDESYFTGYMRLNKTSVMESKVEYDVTLYSSIGDLFGNIGNNLLNELNFNDRDYLFNHFFDQYVVTDSFNLSIFAINSENPLTYFYPIVHNGYEYSGDTVNLSGVTVQDQTRLYTTSGPISGYTTPAAAFAAGVKQYRINSPNQGILDNQLKPALNIYSLIQLMFKTYGYTIKSDFFNTPWFKALYMYGYFSSDRTKFGYNMPSIDVLPLEGVEVILVETFVDTSEYPCGTQYIRTDRTYTIYVVKSNSGIPCYCSEDINLVLDFIQYPCNGGSFNYSVNLNIPANTTGTTYSWVSNQYVDCGYGCPFSLEYVVNLGLNTAASNVSESSEGLAYLPIPAGTFVTYQDGDTIDFSLVISDTIKQIDLLSSIAKKFNLVFVPDPENKNQIIIEPYNYYIGTGDIHDWSDKISWDKGFTVEPALNYIESQLTLTDQEDGDYGNQEFKARNNRIYGQNIVYNPTDFKSQEKKIDTIFSPELIRTWDENISLPLGINYAGSSQTVASGGSESLAYIYKGLKTKPKLMFWLGGFNPFLDIVGEAFPYSGASAFPTYNIYVSDSDANVSGRFEYIPIISHTMPIGNPDSNKINNDSLCNLFNSEEPISIGTTTAYNAYTENDIYSVFYQNRINNLYNPNTRFLSGYFNLKYNDVKNLKANDLIKINEQYFTWNKIDGFNLTNPELSKVEVIQANNNPSEYPTRYFEYYYCDNPSLCYKFKTDFTNPNLRDTNYFWSVLYDYYVGILGGNVSGFTSSFADIQNSTLKYIPYFMYEISKDDYNTSTCLNWDCDTLHNFIYSYISTQSFSYFIPGFWFSSGINDLPPAANTKQGLNVYANCSAFASAATTYGITTGSSIYHGSNLCPSPTPTPTPTPSNTPNPTPTPTPSATPPLAYDGNLLSVAFRLGQPDPGIYDLIISRDAGQSFTSIYNDIGSGRGIIRYCMSADSQIIYFVVNEYLPYIKKSINGGVTWFDTTIAPPTNFKEIKCSGDGSVVALYSTPSSSSCVDRFYVSTDGLTTLSSYEICSTSTFGIKNSIPINSFDMTNTGFPIVLTAYNENNRFQRVLPVYTLTGQTSTFQDVGYLPVSRFIGTRISDNAQTIIGGAYNINTLLTSLKVTNNGGATSYNSVGGKGLNLAMSSTGKYILVGSSQNTTVTTGFVALSTNSGVTFNQISGLDNIPTNLPTSTLVMSHNGKNMYIQPQTSFGYTGLYVSNDYGTTWSYKTYTNYMEFSPLSINKKNV